MSNIPSIEELDKLLRDIELLTGGEFYDLDTFEEAKKLITTHIQAVVEGIIGPDREYSKYSECPSGCGMQYGCACDSAEFRIKEEQRQRLNQYLGKGE